MQTVKNNPTLVLHAGTTVTSKDNWFHAQLWQLSWDFQEIPSLPKFGVCCQLKAQPQKEKEKLALSFLLPPGRGW